MFSSPKSWPTWVDEGFHVHDLPCAVNTCLLLAGLGPFLVLLLSWVHPTTAQLPLSPSPSWTDGKRKMIRSEGS